MKLTAAQIATVAATAGFKDREALTSAVAVALAESGGDTQVVNTTGNKPAGSRDRGLWQINSYWHKEVTDAQAFDPRQAAAAVARISKQGTDWSQWATWPAAAALTRPAAVVGVQQMYANLVSGAAQSIGGPGDVLDGLVHDGLGAAAGAGDVLGDVLDPLEGVLTIASLAVKAAAWMADPHNWTRILMVSAGGVGVLLALRMVAEAGGAGDVAAAPLRVVKKAAGAGAMVASGGTSKVATTAAKAAGAAKAAS